MENNSKQSAVNVVTTTQLAEYPDNHLLEQHQEHLEMFYTYKCKEIEQATRLSHALELNVQSTEFIQLSKSDVWEFIKFMHPVKCAIQRREAFGSPVSFSSLMLGDARNERFEIEGVNHVFCDSLRKIGVVSKGTGKPAWFGKQRKRLANCTLLVPVSFNSKGVRKHFKVVEGSGGNVLGEFEAKKSFKKV
ncbi:hypothetical protein KY284_036127 [Solanum tuberosum]|nr:hypothetical protein KY284_036127 [Solanum tuberosum]